MPTNLVKTKKDEHLWSMAQKRASDQYDIDKNDNQFWAITTGIYKRMKGKDKQADISAKIDKTGFLKLAKDISADYFNVENQQLTDLVVKIAIVQEMNDSQIETLCATTNHLVHSAMQKEKEAQEDQSVEFEIARPEDVIVKVADLCEVPDDVYMDVSSLFTPKIVEKEAEELNYGEEMQRTVRAEQILHQNIKNIAAAHSKLATEVAIESAKADEASERLYALIRQAVENGKDISILKDALGKAFDDQGNFVLVWDDVTTRLIADGIIEKPISDLDRGSSLVGVENWSPNRDRPIIATASELDRRITKMRTIDATMLGLEDMAKIAGEDLSKNIMRQKTEFSKEAVTVGVARWFLKKKVKSVAKGTVKGAIKKKIPKAGLITGAFVGTDVVGGAAGKKVRLG